MTKRKDDAYQFPCAVIRGNERTLLGRSDLLRVIEARQFSQAMNILAVTETEEYLQIRGISK